VHDVTKILIVEHSKADIEFVLRELKNGGINFTSEVVEKEKEFVTTLQKFQPDIILSDYSLPSFSGTLAFSLALSISPRTPFIFVSGTVGEATAVEMIKSGVTDYVLKDALYTLPSKVKRAIKEAGYKAEKEQAQKELKKNEQQYRLLFESNPNPMWLLDNATDKFLAVNDAAIRQYGYSRDEFLKMDATQIRPEEDVQQFIDFRNNSKQNPEYRGIWRHVKKDGSIIHVDIFSRLVDIEGKPARMIMVNDITEKLAAENQLKALNERVSVISQATQDVIWDWNLVDNTCWWNDNFYTFFGYEKKTYPQFIDVWEQGIHPDDRVRVLESVHDFIKSGKSNWTSEYRYLKKNGTVVTVFDRGFLIDSEEGKPTRMIGSMVDITERKLFGEALEQLTANLKSIFDNTDVGFLLLDRSGSIVSYNEPAQLWASRAFGKQLFRGENLRAFMSEGRMADFANVLNLVESGTALNFETQYPSNDGTTDWYHVMIRPVPHTDGTTSGICISVTNITKRKEHENEISSLNAELEQRVKLRTADLEEANKMLESYSYTVSHDLRAPLRTINGYARIIESEYESVLNNDVLELFRNIQRSAKNMGELIDDLLSFSKLGKQAIHKSNVDMNQLVAFVWKELTGINTCSAVLNTNNLPLITADASLLKQVLMNLLSNSLKYSSKCTNPIIEVGAIEKENEVVYYVKDNGVGFDMKYAGKLFGVFQRLHSASEYEGTGIGLANVKRIIDKHEGSTWAIGEENAGATFYFSLPKV
jgi:PAS domain S-box-containing protein